MSARATTRDPDPLRAANALDPAAARALFTEYGCGSERWLELMVAGRPYPTPEALLAASQRAFDALTDADWREAFAAHSEIGAPKAGDERGAAEQSGLAGDDPATAAAIRRLTADHRERFGHVFLIRARGRDGAEILAELRRRLDNSPAQELREAAGAQREIAALRLSELAGAGP